MRRAGCLLLVLALSSCPLSYQKTYLIVTFPQIGASPSAARSEGPAPRIIHVQTATFRITVSGGSLAAPIVSTIGGSSSPTTATIALPGAGRYDVTAEGLDPGSVVLTRGTASIDAIAGANSLKIVMLPITPLKLYVSNRASGTVSVINGADGSTSGTISVAAEPTGIGVNSATRKIYVAHFGQDVTVINGSTDAVSTTITYGSSGDYASVGINPVTNKVYAAWQYDGIVQVVNGATDSITGTYSANTYPTDIAVNTATNKVYVLDWGSWDIQVLDGTTDSLATTIPFAVGSFNEKCGIAANSTTNKIYFADGGTPGLVYVIDGATDAALTTITVGGNLPYPDDGTGIAVNSVTNRVYVTNAADNTISVINGLTDAVIATIPVGTAPRSVAVSKYYNRVYVVNRIDGVVNGTISIIDGATNTVAKTVSVGVDPQLIAVLED